MLHNHFILHSASVPSVARSPVATPAHVTWPGCYEWSQDTHGGDPRLKPCLGRGLLRREGALLTPRFPVLALLCRQMSSSPQAWAGRWGGSVLLGTEAKAAGVGAQDEGPVAEKRTQPATLLTRAAAGFGLQGLPASRGLFSSTQLSLAQFSRHTKGKTGTPPQGESKHSKGGKEL